MEQWKEVIMRKIYRQSRSNWIGLCELRDKNIFSLKELDKCIPILKGLELQEAKKLKEIINHSLYANTSGLIDMCNNIEKVLKNNDARKNVLARIDREPINKNLKLAGVPMTKEPESLPSQASHKEICDIAINHYYEISDKCCHFNSTVALALHFYKAFGPSHSTEKKELKIYDKLWEMTEALELNLNRIKTNDESRRIRHDFCIRFICFLDGTKPGETV